MNQQITMFRGKDIEEMSREELIEAVKYLGARLSESWSYGNAINRAWADFCRAKSL